MNYRMSQSKDNLLGVLRTLFRWKKAIFYFCLAVGVLAAVVVLLVPVYYQAATVFFVASPDQSKPELIFGSSTTEPEFYGDDSDIDRMLTIAESNELVDFLIDSFNLYRHYDIDSTKARAPYYLKLHFFDLYDVRKTKRDAILLSIEDRDPDTATRMTRAARDRINTIAQNLVRATQAQKIQTYRSSIGSKTEQLAILSDSLVRLRKKYGIYNALAQSELLTQELTSAEARLAYTEARLGSMRETRQPQDSIRKLQSIVVGLEKEVEKLTGKLGLFNDGVALVETFNAQYKEANQALSEEQEKLKQYQAAYNADIPALILVEEAELPIIKSRPRRTLIVLAAVVLAFLFAVIGVLLFDNYQDTDWREIYHGR